MDIDPSQVYKVVDGNGFRVFIGNAEITKVKGIACGDIGDGWGPTVTISLSSRIKYLFLYDSTYPSLDAVLSIVDEIEQLLRELKS